MRTSLSSPSDEGGEKALAVGAVSSPAASAAGTTLALTCTTDSVMRVVEVEAVRERAVDQRRPHRRQPRREADHRGVAGAAGLLRRLERGAAEGHGRAGERDAEQVEQVQLGLGDHGGGEIAESQLRRERGESFACRGHGRVFLLDRVRGAFLYGSTD